MDERFSNSGPFTVVSEGNPYLAKHRCWLTSDPEKKIVFEGNSRELAEFFENVCRQPKDGEGIQE